MWVKGQTGNAKGRPKRGAALSDLLREVGEEPSEGAGSVQYKYLLARRIWRKALEGEQWACSLIFNRLEGLPVARTEIETDVEVRVIYVEAHRVEIAATASGPAASVERSAEVQCLPSGQ